MLLFSGQRLPNRSFFVQFIMKKEKDIMVTITLRFFKGIASARMIEICTSYPHIRGKRDIRHVPFSSLFMKRCFIMINYLFLIRKMHSMLIRVLFALGNDLWNDLYLVRKWFKIDYKIDRWKWICGEVVICSP